MKISSVEIMWVKVSHCAGGEGGGAFPAGGGSEVGPRKLYADIIKVGNWVTI